MLKSYLSRHWKAIAATALAVLLICTLAQVWHTRQLHRQFLTRTYTSLSQISFALEQSLATGKEPQTLQENLVLVSDCTRTLDTQLQDGYYYISHDIPMVDGTRGYTPIPAVLNGTLQPEVGDNSLPTVPMWQNGLSTKETQFLQALKTDTETLMAACENSADIGRFVTAYTAFQQKWQPAARMTPTGSSPYDVLKIV